MEDHDETFRWQRGEIGLDHGCPGLTPPLLRGGKNLCKMTRRYFTNPNSMTLTLMRQGNDDYERLKKRRDKCFENGYKICIYKNIYDNYD